MKLIPSTNGPKGIAWLQLVELPSDLNEDGSRPNGAYALTDARVRDFIHEHDQCGMLVVGAWRELADGTPQISVDLGAQISIDLGGARPLVTGTDSNLCAALRNALCGLAHWVEPYDPRVVWSDPSRRCGICSTLLGEHPQSSRTVERIGPYMQKHLTEACNGTLLDFGGWAPQKERAWWRRVDELKAQGKWPPWEHRDG